MTPNTLEWQSVMWLLPVVFMLHDFEEIIVLRPWLEREAGYLQQHFPRLATRVLPHFSQLSTSAFALAVAEEFVLLSAVTLFTVEREHYALWAGLVLAFGLHLVFHIVQFAV
jgi:hypothetical protein